MFYPPRLIGAAGSAAAGGVFSAAQKQDGLFLLTLFLFDDAAPLLLCCKHETSGFLFYIRFALCGVRGDRFHAGTGNNILTQYNCTRKQENGYTCFDVYMAQGRPLNTQEYTLLQERVEKQAVTPQPQCPTMEPTCDAFLKALNYNLEFSWYLVNFPTSSFPQCRETYDCKRIDCYLPPAEGEKEATLVSCVYKRNQVFFVGAQVTCRQTLR